jgi:hypothetical protein
MRPFSFLVVKSKDFPYKPLKMSIWRLSIERPTLASMVAKIKTFDIETIIQLHIYR